MVKLKSRKNVPELPLIGDVDEWEADTIKALLEIPQGGECVLYLDSAGGSVYGALAVLSVIRIRRLKTTAVVLGECSSAALLLFGSAQRRLVSPFCTLLFHRMRWQSDKRIDSNEARQWTAHFLKLEEDVDDLQARLFGPAENLVRKWTEEGRYLTGKEVAEAGLAELIELK
jgi:ATP-dependent protease ClpP protease subunit